MSRLRFATMLDTAKLKASRIKRKMTMAEAAKVCGMHTQAYERIENGDGLSLTMTSLNKIAVGLRVSAKRLLK